ncbi:hypothetical protein M8C21_002577 [Ambrosia artemisiifolia]|uniref:BZIP domain-containing protein n=1 Tax=Ambrosia artemisiifolia TaxID=4212 RepID=A0AAD5BZJ9_AMBAR|nr:hypothetical protein M8C21_002577 [Ambrosia artemisiifolia]
MPSLGSDGDPKYANLDERESARPSRAKKQQKLDELLAEISRLQNENNTIMKKIDGALTSCIR